jgi:hypothetical protein
MYSSFYQLQQKIKQYTFQDNIHCMNKYQLLLKCKSMNITQYSKLPKKHLIKKILNKRKMITKQKIMNSKKTKFVCCLPIIYLILDFVDFSENIFQMRCLEIDRSFKLLNGNSIIMLKQWFTKHYPLEINKALTHLTHSELLKIYECEQTKFSLLATDPCLILHNPELILQWFKYLYYNISLETIFNTKLLTKKFCEEILLLQTFKNKRNTINYNYNVFDKYIIDIE